MTETPKDPVLPEPHLSFSTFVGQEALKQNFRARIEAAKRNSKPLPHFLLCGPSEMGKATFAKAVANELQRNFRSYSAATIERPGDLAVLVTNSDDGELLIIEEFESIRATIRELLIPIVERRQFEVVIGKGPTERSITLDLKQFTLVCATSRPSQIDKRLRRWMLVCDVAAYTTDEIGQIICLLGRQQGLTIDLDAAKLMAGYCGGSPGNAKVLITRLQEHMNVSASAHVPIELAREALLSFGYLQSSSTSISERLCNMSALEFEEFVADLFRKNGYAVEITQGSGDHGIDLLMRKDNRIIAVQCKRWDAPVGEPVIRDFLGSLMGVGAKFGYVIAASTFTSKAFSFAQNKPIKLIDLDALVNMVTQGVEDEVL